MSTIVDRIFTDYTEWCTAAVEHGFTLHRKTVQENHVKRSHTKALIRGVWMGHWNGHMQQGWFDTDRDGNLTSR